MNLSSLSSELNISIGELRNRARAKGFFISPKANKIDNQLAKQILDNLKAPSQREQIADRQAAGKKVNLPSFIKVRDFADLLGIPAVEAIKALIKNGVMATINEEIDFDTAAITAGDLGFEVGTEATKEQSYGMSFLQQTVSSESEENLKPRPPIVAVMGHVDHGKTTLLDSIRKTSVAEGESGGITQHIGAYQVKHNNRLITFLDTPGHEAFSEMRARGANVTDLIVLVVAADDGVRPQTVEVINRAKFANTPIIVAINKVDKENANPMRVKQELSEHGVVTEEWGGKTIAVEISAKKGQGIDQLLEMILLSAEVENFRANPDGATAGTVIESKQTTGKGVTATIIVQNGTLKVGDIFVAGPGYGRIKSLEDEKGRKLKMAGPSTPAQISGFSEQPEAGDILQICESLEQAKEIATKVQKQQRSHRLNTQTSLVTDAANKSLNLIIKADVAGSLEAIKQSIGKLKNDEVKVNILSEGVGEINESDILLAATSKANVLAFRIKANPKAVALAKQKAVMVDSYEVIYELIEDVTTAVVKLFTPEFEKVSFGKGKILGIFRTEKGQMIVGGRVEEGELRKSKPIAILREGTEIGRGEILEMQQQKVPAKEVSRGNEFGMKIKTSARIAEGDIIESFEESLKQKTL